MSADLIAQYGPAILGAVATGGIILVPMATDVLVYRARVKRFMPLIRRTFEIVDPLLNEYIKSYGPSDVRFAINLTTQVLADGSLSVEEARFVYQEIERRYSPEKAASKALPLSGSQERAVYEAIKRIMDSGKKPSLATLIEAAREISVEVAKLQGKG